MQSIVILSLLVLTTVVLSATPPRSSQKKLPSVKNMQLRTSLPLARYRRSRASQPPAWQHSSRPNHLVNNNASRANRWVHSEHEHGKDTSQQPHEGHHQRTSPSTAHFTQENQVKTDQKQGKRQKRAFMLDKKSKVAYFHHAN
ncbi:unnamed protein product [Adineta steineri]|uniref:Secreted protein n=1 Tax=Adineta steineri TaxID=433720 RepID=A0A814N645_9BILA|nr:unnamed protein product [Adineta steineri]CAF3816920.1 unnamed protein product [Adineta steineri]